MHSQALKRAFLLPVPEQLDAAVEKLALPTDGRGALTEKRRQAAVDHPEADEAPRSTQITGGPSFGLIAGPAYHRPSQGDTSLIRGIAGVVHHPY